MSFLTTLFLMFLIAGVAMAYLFQKAAKNPEISGGIVKFLVAMFKK